jgi:hypothetical protein
MVATRIATDWDEAAESDTELWLATRHHRISGRDINAHFFGIATMLSFRLQLC